MTNYAGICIGGPGDGRGWISPRPSLLLQLTPHGVIGFFSVEQRAVIDYETFAYRWAQDEYGDWCVLDRGSGRWDRAAMMTANTLEEPRVLPLAVLKREGDYGRNADGKPCDSFGEPYPRDRLINDAMHRLGLKQNGQQRDYVARLLDQNLSLAEIRELL